MTLASWVRAKFVRLRVGERYATGDPYFLRDVPVNLNEVAAQVLATEKKLRVEIIGLNRQAVSYRVSLVTGISEFKLVEARAVAKSRFKHMVAKGILQP